MSNNRGMSAEFERALTQTEVDAKIVLYDFDLSGIGGDVFHLHNGMNGLNQPVTWRGIVYEPYPIEAEGFEMSGKGPSARPQLKMSNAMGFITGINDRLGGLSDGVVTRRQTQARWLDAVNFPDGNPLANPSQEVVSRYVIDRLASRNKELAVIELASPAELDGSTIPAGIILANVCTLSYRDTCPYRGGPVADRYDMPTDDPKKDDCSRGLGGCGARFGENAVFPATMFVGVDKLS